MTGMDITGSALVALWVIAVGVVVVALLGFAIWLKVGEMARVVAPSPLDRVPGQRAGTTKDPSHPEG